MNNNNKDNFEIITNHQLNELHNDRISRINSKNNNKIINISSNSKNNYINNNKDESIIMSPMMKDGLVNYRQNHHLLYLERCAIEERLNQQTFRNDNIFKINNKIEDNIIDEPKHYIDNLSQEGEEENNSIVNQFILSNFSNKNNNNNNNKRKLISDDNNCFDTDDDNDDDDDDDNDNDNNKEFKQSSKRFKHLYTSLDKEYGNSSCLIENHNCNSSCNNNNNEIFNNIIMNKNFDSPTGQYNKKRTISDDIEENIEEFESDSSFEDTDTDGNISTDNDSNSKILTRNNHLNIIMKSCKYQRNNNSSKCKK
jgi:hypothetical protein